MNRTHSDTTYVAAPVHAVYSRLTDIGRLPDWNAAIRDVLLRPSRLEPGAEWVVTVHAGPLSWPSRASALEVDRERHRFSYRSMRDGGNPSYTLWRWEVDAAGGGSTVTVTWQLSPRTPLYRTLLFPMRRFALAREVRAALAALAALVEEPAT